MQEALLRQTARFHTRHHNHEQAAAAYEKLIAMDSNDVQVITVKDVVIINLF